MSGAGEKAREGLGECFENAAKSAAHNVKNTFSDTDPKTHQEL